MGPAAAALPLWLRDMDLRRVCHDQRRVGERGGHSRVLLREQMQRESAVGSIV